MLATDEKYAKVITRGINHARWMAVMDGTTYDNGLSLALFELLGNQPVALGVDNDGYLHTGHASVTAEVLSSIIHDGEPPTDAALPFGFYRVGYVFAIVVGFADRHDCTMVAATLVEKALALREA